MNKEEFKKLVISEATKIIEQEKQKECTDNLSEETHLEDKPKPKEKAIKDKPKTPKVKKSPKTPEAKKSRNDKTKATKNKPKTPKSPKTKKVDENLEFDMNDISVLTEEIKKINKVLDLNEPLISETIETSLLSEGEKDRMRRLYNYKVISDDDDLN